MGGDWKEKTREGSKQDGQGVRKKGTMERRYRGWRRCRGWKKTWKTERAQGRKENKGGEEGKKA